MPSGSSEAEGFLDEASTLIFSTSAERDKALSQFSIPASEVVHWPVDPVCMDGRVEARRAIRQRLRHIRFGTVLVYFGRLHSMKKPLETISAVCKSQRSDLHLIVVGNDQDVTQKDCIDLARKGAHQRVST